MPERVASFPRLAVLTLLLLLPTASLPAAGAGFTATSSSPGNVLGTLVLAAPTQLAATAQPGGAIALSWRASTSAMQHNVEYVVLRRPSGSGQLAEVARTGLMGYTDVTYIDAPPAGAYDYAVRTIASSFSSADTPSVTITTLP